MRLLLKSKFFLTVGFFLLCASFVSGQDIPEPMSPPRLVNDFAGIFSSVEQQALEQKLLAYNDSTSTQIYVVTVGDLKGYAISDFAFRLGEEWGIGRADKDNGAVILIKPQTGDSRGQAFIATGYGLEALINDAFAGRIVRNEMIPYFQENDYFGGVNAAIDVMIARLSGEYDADEEDSEGKIPLVAIIIIVFFLILFLRIFFGGGGDQHIDGDGHHRGGGGPIFIPPVFGRGSGGGFGGGGFGGGGFGGGGGGSFGGGGAGGSW